MKKSRSYDSPARERQARETRRAVLAAAAELFVGRGYVATSVGAVADRAGVSAQTVYNTVGTKRELLKAAYDVTLIGDDEPVPLSERPHVRALYAQTDPEQFLRGYAALGRETAERIGPLMLQIEAGAAAGEPDLVAYRQLTDEQRLIGVGMVVRRLGELDGLDAGLSPDRARDRIWTLNSIQVWHLLTGSRGWSGEDYQHWIGDAMCAAVLRRS